MPLENGIPEIRPRPGFLFYLLTTVVVTGCLAAICYLGLLRGWYGDLEISAAKIPAAWANDWRVLVTNNSCRDRDIRPEVKAWEQLLRRAAIPYETVSGVPSQAGRGAGVLLLPSAECLTEASRNAIRKWLQKGGSVVATGALGLRDESGRVMGTGFLQEIADTRITQTLRADSPVYITLAARPPLGLALTPGERWRIHPGTWMLASSSSPDSYWSDARLNPLQGTSVEEAVAMTHHSVGLARVVWFGVGPEALEPHERNRSSWEKLFLNGVSWAGRQPLAGVSTWPGAQAVAVVVAQEVREESELPEASTLGRLLAAEKVPATFFLRAPRGEVSSSLKELARIGEVAVLSESRVASSDREHETVLQQREWLEKSSQRPVLGFRASSDATQKTTLSELAEAGYAYYLVDRSPIAAAPTLGHFRESFLFPLDARELVELPRLGRNDFEILSQYKGPANSAEAIAEQLWRDFRKARQAGGLFVLQYRTDLLGGPTTREAILRFVDRVKAADVWFASASEVARWWRQREQMGVEVARLSPRRIRVVLSNKGNEDLDQVLVLIGLPFLPAKLGVTSAVLGAHGLSYQVLADLELLHIRVRRLKAQSRQTWLVDLR